MSKYESRTRAALFSMGALLSLCLQASPSRAKLDVPYGPDGSPPDPDTQAAVDAYNDALDGPDPGQSTASWEKELQAAHDALYSRPVTTTTTSTSPTVEILDSADMCQSPLNLWMKSTSSKTVAESLGKPGVVAELTADLEQYLYGILYLELSATPVQIGQPDITSLSCAHCTMTYLECLEQGLGVTWCKQHALNCPVVPVSALSITIPITAPLTGRITFEASASYREVDDPNNPADSWPYQWCLNVRAYDTSGFGALDGMVRKYVDQVVSQGAICDHAWNWNY